jgi:hypothetical protein
MRRLVAWIGGAAGGITAYRLMRRRSQAVAEPAPVEADTRAEELRAKLDESRVAEPAAESAAEPVAAEPVAEDDPAVEPESPEERRRRVHDEGRAALDEMKSE